MSGCKHETICNLKSDEVVLKLQRKNRSAHHSLYRFQERLEEIKTVTDVPGPIKRVLDTLADEGIEATKQMITMYRIMRVSAFAVCFLFAGAWFMYDRANAIMVEVESQRGTYNVDAQDEWENE